ncbi:general stress protein [Planosporangium sp. 12N6]|uniref:general stress protein n=1 Tax=Planosporangium spinosum TaxID=3402278 RepID=UPI003CF4A7D4
MTVLRTRRALRPGAPRWSRPVVTEHAQLTGRTQIASFASYRDAERTVDLLARTHFPVHRLAIVGGGLKLVSEPGGGVTAGRAGSLGACGGLWVGVLMMLFAFAVGRPVSDSLPVVASWVLPVGALFGGVVGLAGYGLLGGADDRTARRCLVPTRHELHVDIEVAASAWRLLLKLHPAGMTLVDRVPAQVVALPTELVLIETFAPTEPAETAETAETPTAGSAESTRPPEATGGSEAREPSEATGPSARQPVPPLRAAHLPAV